MYQGKTISVALAAYNGEKYIREQVESILNQTVVPDEIVISDDGSKDQTVAIARNLAFCHPQILVLTDNTQHGFAFNFAHAISHCSGDIIFLSDQDDIWDIHKVEHVVDVYSKYPDALCVFHNAVSVDSNGNPSDILFNPPVQELANLHSTGEVVKIPGDVYCETAASYAMVNGMIMSVSRELLKTAFPFPPMASNHDGWLWFCSEALDSCYFLNEILTHRRLHTDNTSGAGGQGFGIRRIKKIINKVSLHRNVTYTRILTAQHMQAFIQKYSTKDNVGAMRALTTLSKITEIGRIELDALRSGRLSGAIKLVALYIGNARYRKSGTNAFLYELANILLQSKKERRRYSEQLLGDAMDNHQKV